MYLVSGQISVFSKGGTLLFSKGGTFFLKFRKGADLCI